MSFEVGICSPYAEVDVPCMSVVPHSIRFLKHEDLLYSS